MDNAKFLSLLEIIFVLYLSLVIMTIYMFPLAILSCFSALSITVMIDEGVEMNMLQSLKPLLIDGFEPSKPSRLPLRLVGSQLPIALKSF